MDGSLACQVEVQGSSCKSATNRHARLEWESYESAYLFESRSVSRYGIGLVCLPTPKAFEVDDLVLDKEQSATQVFGTSESL